MGTSGFPHVVATIIVMRPAPIQRDFGIEPQIVEFLFFIDCHSFDKKRYDEVRKMYSRPFLGIQICIGNVPGAVFQSITGMEQQRYDFINLCFRPLKLP